MKARTGIHLQYGFTSAAQPGAELENPLFDLLNALHAHGSIRHAAKAMDRSYRHVWGAVKHWEEVLNRPLVDWSQGKRAALTPFAQRLLWAERQARARMAPHIEALRAELLHVLAQAEDPGIAHLDMAASHDLALPSLQEACAAQRLHMNLRFTGSEEALRALNEGRCQVAGFHVARLAQASQVIGQSLRPLLQPGRHKLIGSHWRRQGWMVRRGHALPQSAADVATAGWRFVNRQPGSGTRLLLDHLLHDAGVPAAAIEGHDSRVEHTHVAVAASVASGVADVGLGLEAAAHEFGLAFQPVAEEDYFFVCLKPRLDDPAVQHLQQVLASPAWARALGHLSGCGVRQAGEVLSLTRALPWWPQLGRRRAAVAPPIAPTAPDTPE